MTSFAVLTHDAITKDRIYIRAQYVMRLYFMLFNLFSDRLRTGGVLSYV